MNNLLTGKVFRIIEVVAASTSPVSLKSLREISGISGAVVSRIVADLIELGIFEKSGYHEVVPSLGIMQMNMAAENSIPLIRKIRPVLNNRLPSLGVSGTVSVLYRGVPLRVFDSRGSRELPPEDDLLTAAFYAAAASLPEMPAELHPEELAEKYRVYDFAEMLESARSNGYIVNQSAGNHWWVASPFSWYGGVGVLTFYGMGGVGSQELTLIAGECHRLGVRLCSILAVP